MKSKPLSKETKKEVLRKIREFKKSLKGKSQYDGAWEGRLWIGIRYPNFPLDGEFVAWEVQSSFQPEMFLGIIEMGLEEFEKKMWGEKRVALQKLFNARDRRCTFIKKNGERCQNPAALGFGNPDIVNVPEDWDPEKDFCWTHQEKP